MADISASQDTTGAAVVPPRKGPLKSFFNFFGGKTLTLNNNLGALEHYAFIK